VKDLYTTSINFPGRMSQITALDVRGDRERCIEAGANEYMIKPVKLNKLVKTINKLTGQTN